MRLIVADDSLLLREGISHLPVEARFQVVGLASTGEEALAQVEQNKPDVAIVDILAESWGVGRGVSVEVAGRVAVPSAGERNFP